MIFKVGYSKNDNKIEKYSGFMVCQRNSDFNSAELYVPVRRLRISGKRRQESGNY